MNVTLRPVALVPSEQNFVRKAWLRTSRASWLRDIPKPVHYELHGRIIARLMAESTVLVAETSQPGELAGFVCFDEAALHFVYVKDLYRRVGVGRQLLAACTARFATYWTYSARDCQLFRKYQFNPYLIEGAKHEIPSAVRGTERADVLA